MADSNHRITLAQRRVGAECFFDGLDNAPLALDRLFTGANLGKVMVRV